MKKKQKVQKIEMTLWLKHNVSFCDNRIFESESRHVERRLQARIWLAAVWTIGTTQKQSNSTLFVAIIVIRCRDWAQLPQVNLCSHGLPAVNSASGLKGVTS